MFLVCMILFEPVGLNSRNVAQGWLAASTLPWTRLDDSVNDVVVHSFF